jgi:hypothetical protein
MATAAPNQNLPMLYRAIEPLNVTQHGKMKVRPVLDMSEAARTHAIPLTVDEFSLVQRHYPIVFSIGEKPIPIALMGLNENVNVFLEADGRPLDSSLYIPAYIRRYPFLLARIRPDSDELSLCFDPTANAVVIDDGSGNPTKCVLPAGVTADPAWRYIVVTGISSCEKVGSELRRLIRVRGQSDVIAL